MENNKPHIDDLYPEYYKQVKSMSALFQRKFYKILVHEELDDLTQSCWEKIVRSYPTYDPSKAQLSGWIGMVVYSALYNYLRSLRTDKRCMVIEAESLDAMTDGHEKYL